MSLTTDCTINSPTEEGCVESGGRIQHRECESPDNIMISLQQLSVFFPYPYVCIYCNPLGLNLVYGKAIQLQLRLMGRVCFLDQILVNNKYEKHYHLIRPKYGDYGLPSQIFLRSHKVCCYVRSHLQLLLWQYILLGIHEI